VLGDLFSAPHVCLIQGGGTMMLAAGFLLLIRTERQGPRTGKGSLNHG